MTTLPRLLDGSMQEVRRLHPLSLSLNEELHALSYATMTLPPGDEIEFHAWVEIYTIGGSAGIYRANKVDTDTATGCQTVKLEHGICALADAVADEDADDVKGTVSQVLARILSYQATQAGGADLWAIGTVEPTDQNISVTVNYNSTMSLLTSLLDQLNECWPEYDQTQLPWTISIRTNGTAPTAEGRIGRNVESAKISYDDRDMANYIYCPKVTGGYMSDAASIAAWGRREGYCKVDDGATAAQAADICSRYLAKRKDPAVAISINMADLSGVTGEALDRIRCGKLYRLALPRFGVTMDETVAAIAWPDVIGRPAEARVSLANHAADLVLNIKKLGKGGGGGKQQNEIDKAIKRFTTSINQTDEYIQLIATETDVATAQELGHSLFQITSDSITAEVVRATGEEAAIRLTIDTIEIVGNVINIKGQQINMGNYVLITNLEANYATITSLDAEKARLDNVLAGNASFTGLACTGNIATGSITSIGGYTTNSGTFDGHTIRIPNVNSGTFLGLGDLDLGHYHGISCSESGGVVTITLGAAQSTAGSDSFNMADTQFYRQGVSAARAAGYAAGVNEFTAVTLYVANYGGSFYLNPYSNAAAVQLYTWDGDPTHTPQSAGLHRWYWCAEILSAGNYAPYSQNSGTYYTRS
ncbi:MAG: hypothetical protein J6S60_04820 [Oscillospiraceae bacterium]|nr:hypothetical protein [Oscillospiraceae bacterium]